MRHGRLKTVAIKPALRLISEGENGETTGADVARQLDLVEDDSALYHALMAAKQEGSLQCDRFATPRAFRVAGRTVVVNQPAKSIRNRDDRSTHTHLSSIPARLAARNLEITQSHT
jgi:hypothetical protein